MIIKKHYITYLINSYKPSFFKQVHKFRIVPKEDYNKSEHLIIGFTFINTIQYTQVIDEFEYLNFLTFIVICYNLSKEN